MVLAETETKVAAIAVWFLPVRQGTPTRCKVVESLTEAATHSSTIQGKIQLIFR